MNSVTCQARGERHRSLTPGELRADGSAGRSLRLSWGSQATPARRAGRTHTAKAPRQPTSCAKGTLTPAASAALMPSEVEYTLVMRPACSGNSRLTRLGKSTLATAIAAPRTTVPKNRASTAPAQRNSMPATRTSRLASNTRSMPNRRATRGAIGESRPKARSGNVVRSPATPLDMPVSARIWPIKGATPVSAGRRLAARSTIPNTRRKLRRRERPDSAVAEVLFVMLRLPVSLQWQGVPYSTWRRKLQWRLIGLLIVPLEGLFREHAPRIRVSFALRKDGPDLVVSCFVVPRPVKPRPSACPHLLGTLVAVEFEALLGRDQVQVLIAFLAHGSLDLPLAASVGPACPVRPRRRSPPKSRSSREAVCRAWPLGSTPEDEPVDGQDDYSSQDCYHEASEIEPEVQHLGPGHEPVEEPSHEGPHHPEEHSDYAPAGVAAWHQQLRDYPRDQPEDYPAEHTQ